jgi:hypothetical protein
MQIFQLNNEGEGKQQTRTTWYYRYFTMMFSPISPFTVGLASELELGEITRDPVPPGTWDSSIPTFRAGARTMHPPNQWNRYPNLYE